jgi:hypothetical protein
MKQAGKDKEEEWQMGKWMFSTLDNISINLQSFLPQ